jgi:hypothetical protein
MQIEALKWEQHGKGGESSKAIPSNYNPPRSKIVPKLPHTNMQANIMQPRKQN